MMMGIQNNLTRNKKEKKYPGVDNMILTFFQIKK